MSDDCGTDSNPGTAAGSGPILSAGGERAMKHTTHVSSRIKLAAAARDRARMKREVSLCGIGFFFLTRPPLVTSFLGAPATVYTISVEPETREEKSSWPKPQEKMSPGRILVNWKRFHGINPGNEEKRANDYSPLLPADPYVS